ncbi:MAG: DNA gyrase inhibitor YacG [Planctomycetaceae bacterium]
MAKCPTCSGPVDLAAAASPPFCCERCRLIDLGRWLDEAHALPLPPAAVDDDESDDVEGASPGR